MIWAEILMLKVGPFLILGQEPRAYPTPYPTPAIAGSV